MKGDRLERVNALMLIEIANFLGINSRENFNAMVNSVIVSPDLKQAKVFLSCLIGKIDIKSLNRLKPELAKHLSKNVKLKYLPKIEFMIINAKTIDRIESIYEKIERLTKANKQK